MPEALCQNCTFFGMEKPGCYYGPHPTPSSQCVFSPSKFWAKDMPESRAPEGFGETWHLVGQKPRIEKAAVITKKKGKAKVARNVKTGRFVKK